MTTAQLFFKTEQTTSTNIEHFTGVKSDFALFVRFPRSETLYLSRLEEQPKASFPIKEFDFATIAKDLRRIDTIEYDGNELTISMLNLLKKHLKKKKWVDITKTIQLERSIKTKKEIEYHTKAAELSEDIIHVAIKQLEERRFTFEHEVITFMKEEATNQGLELSFEPIVATGNNSIHPHYVPKHDSRIRGGFCIIDFGVKYKGHCGDITRTIYIGKPNAEELKAYFTVKNELYRLEKELRAGHDEFEVAFPMIHSVGHGMGLSVHEYPRVGKDELVEDMIITLEPAQYESIGGIRIEDNYLVTKKGLKRLTKSSRELIVI